jgi:hypothetical protein
MADTAPQIVQGSSKEAVAYALLLAIALKEGKISYGGSTPYVMAEEGWVFETYRKCLIAAGGGRT